LFLWVKYNSGMRPSQPETVEYLVLGHITADIVADKLIIGGTAAYSSLTAHALGLQSGVVTVTGHESDLSPLNDIAIAGPRVERSTTFENISTPMGRRQILHHHAPAITAEMIPGMWASAAIVHLGPIAHETPATLLNQFPNSFIGITPQGWLRQWDQDGVVSPNAWPEMKDLLPDADAVVISREDLQDNQQKIDKMAEHCKLLVVTRGRDGADIYLDGSIHSFSAPPQIELDAVGAGDIFATAFFVQYNRTGDPLEAARFACYIGSQSVKRIGLNSVPTQSEIQKYLVSI
jgi:sugar/nucleoside kinase (ribokinase family)